MQVSYPANITEQADGSYLVQFIDLPDTFTEGQTMDEALFNASEVLSGMLCWHVEQGHDITPATLGANNIYIEAHQMNHLDSYEAEILAAYDNDEIKPNGAPKADLEKYRLAASVTFTNAKKSIFQS